jgi:hypothetical protein
MTDYRRNFITGCGFFFERLWDVQQGDGFRKGSTHPTGLGAAIGEVCLAPASPRTQTASFAGSNLCRWSRQSG